MIDAGWLIVAILAGYIVGLLDAKRILFKMLDEGGE